MATKQEIECLANDMSAALTVLHKRITQEYSAKFAALEKRVADLENATKTAKQEAAAARQEAAAARQDLVATRTDIVLAKKELAKREDNAAVLAKMDELLAVTDKKINDIMPIVAKETTSRVLAVVERDIVPKVNSAIQWMAYQTSDTAEVVDDYRKNVMGSRGDTKQFGHFTLGYN